MVVRFEVTDTGIGIDARGSVAALRGLLAGRRLHHAEVRRHRARPGHLPRARDGDGRLDRCRQPARPRAAPSGSRCPWSSRSDPTVTPPRQTDLLRGLRVLVVDDNQTNRVILHDQLSAWGMSRRRGRQRRPGALARSTRPTRDGRPFDLAVLDLCMPEHGRPRARHGGSRRGRHCRLPRLVLLTSGPDVGARAGPRRGHLGEPDQARPALATPGRCSQGLVGDRAAPGSAARGGRHRPRAGPGGRGHRDQPAGRRPASSSTSGTPSTSPTTASRRCDALARASYDAVLMDVPHARHGRLPGDRRDPPPSRARGRGPRSSP